MPRARSMMHSHEIDISGFPEEQKLALDLADTYSSDYDEPTIKVQVQPIASLVDLNDVEDDEDTLIMPAPVVESRYPGIGLVLALTLGTAMWFLPCYYFIMWVIFR
jgi:hypothetical protein